MKMGLAYFFTLSTNSVQPPFPMPKLPRTNSPTFIPKGQSMISFKLTTIFRLLLKTLCAALSAGGTITEQEILYSRFTRKSRLLLNGLPTSFFLRQLQQVTLPMNLTPCSTRCKVNFSNLLNQGLWHPSDKTPGEQTLAMVGQQHQPKTKRVAK